MGFKEFKEQAKPQGLKASELAESKEAFCIVSWELTEGEYKNQKTYQHRTDIIHLVDGKRNSESVFLPASKLFQNLFEGFKEHPEYKHNLYLHMDGRAYDIDQYEGVCPCKHGTNGNSTKQAASSVSRETPKEVEPDFFSPDGTPLNFSTQPGSATAAQLEKLYKSALPLARLGIKLISPEEVALLSEREADEKIQSYAMIAFGLQKAETK